MVEPSARARCATLVSVIVLTFNRRDEVLRTLGMLAALPEQPPIVVVDNASTDGSGEAIVERFPQVTLVRLSTNLGAAGRNYGVAAVHTPYVAFCDDDTWWSPGSLARAVEILERHRTVALVCARILIGESERVDSVSICMANSPLPANGLPGQTIIGFMAGASMIRVAAFRQVGGYCPRLFLGCEEELMALDLARCGWHMLYCDELIVHHFPSRNRHPPVRSALAARNAVWIACLRLRWREVVRRLAAIMALRGVRLRTLCQTMLGLPWALSERTVIPSAIEQMRARVAAQDHPTPLPSAGTPIVMALIQRVREIFHADSP